MKLKLYKGILKRINNITWLAFEIEDKNHDELKKLLENEILHAEIEKPKKKRSLTANGYLFVLLTKLAKKLGNSLGNQYVMAIRDYGEFINGFAMHKQSLNVFESEWNAKATSLQHTLSMVEVTNEFNSKGVEWVEFICFRGSSEYDSKQFSVLLEGVIRDCKEQNIETISTKEVDRLIKLMESEEK